MMLCNIPKVSIKTAERILLNYGDIATLIQDLKNTDAKNRIENLQNIPNIGKTNRKLPKDVCNNIVKYLIE